MLWLFLIIVLFVAFRWHYRKYFKVSKLLKHDLVSLPILGISHMFFGSDEDRMSSLQTVGREALRKDGMICDWLAYRPYVVIADPTIAEFVTKACLEKDDLMKQWKVFMGNSSIIAPVSIWRPRRKILVPTFSSKNLKLFMNTFSDQSEELMNQLKNTTGQPVSTFDYMIKYSMGTICRNVLGVPFDFQKLSEINLFIKAIHEGKEIISKRHLQPWLHCDAIFKLLPIYKTLIKHIEYCHDFLHQIITSQQKRLQKEKQMTQRNSQNFKSFLELLFESSGGEQGYSNQELMEELLTLLIGGSDTTAIGLSFTILILARYPDVQEKVCQEIREVFRDMSEPMTSEHLVHLKYLNAVIKETLRLHTPVPLIVRKVDKDLTLPSGVVLPEGCGIVIHQWAINRNPRFWGDDAEEFRPERFLEGNLEHPAQFTSFSLGPRNCPGIQYAMNSSITVIATLLRHYRLTPVQSKDKPIRLKFNLMMKDVDNFMVQLESRM